MQHNAGIRCSGVNYDRLSFWEWNDYSHVNDTLLTSYDYLNPRHVYDFMVVNVWSQPTSPIIYFDGFESAPKFKRVPGLPQIQDWNSRLFQDFFRTRSNFFKDRQWQEFYKSVSKNMNGQSHSYSEWSQSRISAFLTNQKQI